MGKRRPLGPRHIEVTGAMRAGTLVVRDERIGLVEIKFTTRELDLMAVLWERGASTVAEVQERLGDELAYTTVLTILRTLEEKGYVGHTQEGKAYRYHTLVGRECAGASAVRRLVQKMFQGSPELLVRLFESSESYVGPEPSPDCRFHFRVL